MKELESGPVPPLVAAIERPGRIPLDDAQRTQIQRALVFIEENIENAIEVADIARVACFTPRHFQRLFQEFTGETVRNHLRRLRAERAAVLMRFLGVNVTEAALAVGFSNSSGLYKVVRERFGCAPDDVRVLPPGWDSDAPPFAVRAVEMPPLRVAFVRHVGDPKGSLRTWMKLLTWARSEGLVHDGVLFAGINHDASGTPIDAVRYDAAITVPVDFRPDPASGVAVRELPGGLTLQHEFRGTIPALEARWDVLTEKWFPRSGWRLRDAMCFDIYPAGEAAWRKVVNLLVNPRALVTATLCIPVEPLGPHR